MKKKRTRILSFIISMLLLFPLSACAKDNGTDTKNATNGENNGTAEESAPAFLLTIAENKASDYTIVVPLDSEDEYAAGFNLYKAIHFVAGVRLTFAEDDIPEGGREILIGNTNRAESSGEKLGSDEWVIKAAGEKIVIRGGSISATAAAVNYFIKNHVETSNGVITLMSDTGIESSYEFSDIKWETQMLGTGAKGYGRLCTTAEGNLMIAYSDGIYMYVRESADNGLTWKDPVKVYGGEKTPNGDEMVYGNAQITLLENNDLMLSYRCHSRKGHNPFYTAIGYCLSGDNGKTWSFGGTVVENTLQSDDFSGFWEPFPCVINGRLAIYYSTDCYAGDIVGFPFVKGRGQTAIVVQFYDEGTGKFGEYHKIMDSSVLGHRMGMSVLTELKGGGYAMVVETNANKSYRMVIKLYFSKDGINWNSGTEIMVPAVTGSYNGAPYIITLPDGRLAVSCQSDYNSGTSISTVSPMYNSVIQVAVSKGPVAYEDAETITGEDFLRIKEHPMRYSVNCCSLWGALWYKDGYLMCTANYMINTSATAYKTLEIYLRRAYIG